MKILDKEVLTDHQGVRIVKFSVSAPDIAAKAKPGQFIVLMVKEEGERIPLTVVKTDRSDGSIIIIAQEAGLTTKLLGKIEPGESLYSIVGPLGHPTQIRKYGKVAIVGGGVGIAEIYPVAAAMKAAGNEVTSIIGSRSKDLLILEKELKGSSDRLIVMTDDGSYGRKGFVTEALREILEKDKQDLVYAVGPIPMMKAVSGVTEPFGVLTFVSLNPLMVDGTGMCGCCRVTVNGEVRFSCVDGPEFDAHMVNWAELVKRNGVYGDKEKHVCRLANI